MKILSKQEFSNKGKLIQNKVFVGFDLYNSSSIFEDVINERLILFDYEDNYGYTLSKSLKEAVFFAAKKVGDKGIFVSILTHEEYSNETDPLHWYLELSEKEQYQNLIWGPLENVIFSENGTWGAFLSSEGIGLLGGTKEFMSSVKLKIPHIDTQIFSFLDYWRDYEKEPYIRTTWIPPLLTHLYGIEKAKELLLKTGTNFEQTGI